MTKSELIAELAQFSCESKSSAENFLFSMEKVLTRAIKRGDEVTIPGIGKLKPKTSAARTGKNPQNGEPVEIPAKKKVAFKASKILLDALNE